MRLKQSIKKFNKMKIYFLKKQKIILKIKLKIFKIKKAFNKFLLNLQMNILLMKNNTIVVKNIQQLMNHSMLIDPVYFTFSEYQIQKLNVFFDPRLKDR